VRVPLIRLSAGIATALLLTGCGAGGSASDPDPTSGGDGQVITITIDGDEITPNVEVPLGEPVTLDITADRAGELHVHSTPEQEVEFDEGETRAELTIDQPGVVEVEDHELGTVIVQLEVS
jgi:hypothetical protein